MRYPIEHLKEHLRESHGCDRGRGKDPSWSAPAPEGPFSVAEGACKGAASPEMTFLTGAVASVGFSEVLFEVFKWVSHERSIKIYLKRVKTSLDYFPRAWIGA